MERDRRQRRRHRRRRQHGIRAAQLAGDVEGTHRSGGFAGRGVPDVAGNADPLTGYDMRVDGQDEVIGGTSAVAPLWAALVARLNQQLGHSLGAANAALYDLGANGFRDITSGNNGSYKAGKGWDACTGLGSPDGQVLLGRLQAGSARAAPAPTGHKPKPGGKKSQGKS